MNKKLVFLSIVLTLFFSSTVFAARPLSTDDAGTVEKGGFECELGFEMAKTENKEYTINSCLKFGLLDVIDIGTEVPFVCIDADNADNKSGFSDVVLNLKYNFSKESEILDLSARFDFKSDAGDDDEGLGSGDKDYALTLIASREFENIIFHLNLGYTFIGSADDMFNYSMAIEKPAGDKCNFVCEVVTETDFSGDFDEHPFEGLIGLNYAINQNLVIDAGAVFPFSEASPDYKLTGGFTFLF